MRTYAQAISEAQIEVLKNNPRCFLFGIGVGDGNGEIFGTTKEAKRAYPNRVFDTPCSESALTGIALGASLGGYYPILIHARHDFMPYSFDQLINHAGPWKAIFGVKTPFMVRAIVGRGWGQSAQHSKDMTPILSSIPGVAVMLSNSVKMAYQNIVEGSKMDIPVIVVEYRHLFNISEEYCMTNGEDQYYKERVNSPF